MTGRACHHYDRGVTSRRLWWLTIAAAVLACGCSSSSYGSSGSPTTSLPPAEAAGRGTGTVPTDRRPGADRGARTRRRRSVLLGLGGLRRDIAGVGNRRARSAGCRATSSRRSSWWRRPVSSSSPQAIDAAWPAELAAEHDVVIDKRIGPYARRAHSAVDALTAAGVTADELAALSAAWQAALRRRATRRCR